MSLWRHDLDPDAMTEQERLAKKRYDSYYVFERMPNMKRFVITVPDETEINTSAILELIEPGASRHAVFTRRVGTDLEIHHQRLNVTIVEMHGVT